ncbi:alpha-amylase family glycosyl hydrolase [Flavobacterium silvaticum]|uniref:Alpha-amylase n=1 Tax=Flavobacterium silvaticum TaxID=1852020 RepID=A0A972FKA3_9FLAO|nr:alpha-amylase family glycosyl hydrolase [Flavobacterium silvaticum]NMH27541.1 alpha-amylase [Flavobacterium silvaticum]
MKKIYRISIALFIGMSLWACNSDDNTAAPSPYEQYGSAFTAMPKKQDAIIYQVNIRSYSPQGNLNGVRDGLTKIKELGANVVYLMPIYPVGELDAVGELGSPYAVKDYKAVNPSFGTLEDLRALVSEAHEMGMAVILDWVANHTAMDNNWITEHPEYYVRNENGVIQHPAGTNWLDVAQLDYNNLEMRKAMIDAMSYWVYNANIDGFRCDAADFVQQSFWSEAIPQLRSIKNQDILMLAEGTRVNHFYAGFDYTFGFGFFSALEKVYSENKPATSLQDANALEYGNNYNEENRIVRYTTNHDVNWSDGTPYELFHGRDGSMAAFAVASTMKSVPMIYNGQEVGYNQRIDFMSAVPIDWNSGDASVLAEYKKIIAFRNSSDAVKRGNYTGYSSASVTAFTMKKDGNEVLVLANMTNAQSNYIFPANLSNVGWNDAFTGQAVALASQIILAPNEYRIFYSL